MAQVDSSLDVTDFAFNQVPQAEPEDLTREVRELLQDDELFAHYASVCALADESQLRQARRYQARLFQSCGSRLRLSEVMALLGLIPAKEFQRLRMTVQIEAPEAA